MAPPPRPTVVVVGGPGTLPRLDERLRRAGVRAVRITAFDPRPTAPGRWLPRLRRSADPDTIVLTSRHGVAAGLVPWLRSRGRLAGRLEFWAAGPGTADALRKAGVRRARRPRGLGAAALLRDLGNRAPRNIVYLRSDRSGPGLARALRDRGHHVVEAVVYRLGAGAALSARDRGALRSAHVWISTSPSGLSALRRQLGPREFGSLRKKTRLIVLGSRSLRAARGHGFRRVLDAGSTDAQRLTRLVLRGLRDASG